MKVKGPFGSVASCGDSASNVVERILHCRSFAAWRQRKLGIVGDTRPVRLLNPESGAVCERKRSAAGDSKNNVVPGYIVKRCPIPAQIFVEARCVGFPNEREYEKLEPASPHLIEVELTEIYQRDVLNKPHNCSAMATMTTCH